MNHQHDHQNSKCGEPGWDILGEYSLNQLSFTEDNHDPLAAGFLFQAAQDAGIPLALLKTIDRTLGRIIKGALANANMQRSDALVTLRLLCQKKIHAGKSSQKQSSQFEAETMLDPNPMTIYSDMEFSGGWGYFLIERGSGKALDFAQCPNHLIDLYLYREGK